MTDSPQLEDGYTRVANELLEAIISAPFSKRQYAVVLAVIRKTYGYNKKSDALSMWEIASMTGIDRANVSRTVAELVEMRVLERKAEGRLSHGQHVPEIGINKQHKEWMTDAKTAQVTDANLAPVSEQHRCQNGTGTDAKTTSVTDANLAQGTDAKMAHNKRQLPKDKKDNKRHIPTTPKNDLPEWLNPTDWEDFKQHRKKIGNPLTDVAETRAINALEKMRAEGQDPAKVIDQSIVQGWKGLFPVKTQNGTGPPNRQQQLEAANQQAVNDFLGRAERIIDGEVVNG